MDVRSPLLEPRLAAALERAHRGEAGAWDDFRALRESARGAGDAALLMLAGAGLAVTGQILSRFRDVEACIEDLAPLRDGSAGLAGDAELLALNGLLVGLLFFRPRDGFVERCAERLLALVERGLDVNLTFAAARTLIYYCEPRDLREPALRLCALVSAREAEPAATPYRRAQWLNLWRRCAHYGRQPRLAEQAHGQMRELAQRHGLREIEFLLVLAEVDRAMPRRDIAAVQAALARAEPLADPARLRDLVLLEFTKTRLARMRGEADTALHHALRARRLAAELQLPPAMLAVYIVNEAQARLLGDDADGARAGLLEAMPMLPEGYARETAVMIDGIDADVAAREGWPDADERLRSLWRSLRERRSYDLFEGFPEFGAQLCVRALERGIEADFVRSLIAQCNLVPPDDAPESWPWPLRIRALGGFGVWRDGLLLAGEGKAQKRPLALLQAVIAHGALREGDGVEIGLLVDELWPDVEAADPKASFEVALSRLRKWLGVDGALKITEGRLSLNARVVWCDVAAFERCCAELQHLLHPHADASGLPRRLDALTALYRGRLFGATTLDARGAGARERLALRYERAVTDAGAHLETHRRWSDALRLYEQALLQDMRAEPIHRALMRCHIALDQFAEARRVFERCRAVLEAELGMPPGAETLALAGRIGALR